MTSTQLETSKPLDELGPVNFVVVEFPAGPFELHWRDRPGAGRPRRCGHDPRHRRPDPDKEPERHRGRDGALRHRRTRRAASNKETKLPAELLVADNVVDLAACWIPGLDLRRRPDLREPLGGTRSRQRRNMGGQLIANGRIPIQAIIASIEADEALAAGGA